MYVIHVICFLSSSVRPGARFQLHITPSKPCIPGPPRSPNTCQVVGQPGLRLNRVRKLAINNLKGRLPPVYIILHVGANDVGAIHAKEWEDTSYEVLTFLRAMFPPSLLIYSLMLPRSSWRYLPPRAAHYARKRYNRRAKAMFERELCLTVDHPSLESHQHLAPDGVHLSATGMDIFTQGLIWVISKKSTQDPFKGWEYLLVKSGR